MLYYLIVALYVLVCLFLIGVILLQQGKGGDIANAFGGGGSSQAVFGARVRGDAAHASDLGAGSVVRGALDGTDGVGTAWLGLGRRWRIDAPPPAPATLPAATPTPTTAPPAGQPRRRHRPHPATPPAEGAAGTRRLHRRAARRRRHRSSSEDLDQAGRDLARSSRSHRVRKWRNWQTHQLEGLAFARTWGFESPLPHQQLTGILRLDARSTGQATGQVGAKVRTQVTSHRAGGLRCCRAGASSSRQQG